MEGVVLLCSALRSSKHHMLWGWTALLDNYTRSNQSSIFKLTSFAGTYSIYSHFYILNFILAI